MDLIIFLVVCIVVLSVASVYLNLPSTKGKIGEWRVKNTLIKLAKTYDGYQFHDVMLGTGEESAQIDNILITQKSAYVIETKNYRGRIYGRENDQNWYQTIKYVNEKKNRRGGTYKKTHIEKNAFYNPVLQNRTHVNKMSRAFPILQHLTVYNIVVFLNRADLTNVEINSRAISVTHLNKLPRLIHEIESKKSPLINQEGLFNFSKEIEMKNTKSKENIQEHVDRIKRKYRD